MAIQDQFQSVLGRAPTAAEIEYLSKFLQEGSLQEFEIGQILQGSPEFQQRQLEKDTTAFGEKLQAGDQRIMQQGADIAGAQAQSRFAGLGRPNSSALAASVFGQQGQLAGNLAQSRQSALANFYGQGLRENASLRGQQGSAAQSRGYGLRDESRQRAYEIEDYYRQQNDYNTAKKSSSGWNAITPEFAVSQAIGLGGSLGGSYLGGFGAGRGMAGKGLFGR